MLNKGDIVKVPANSFWETLSGLKGVVINVRPKIECYTVEFTMENGQKQIFTMGFEEVELAQP